jgi:hypothetical protein
MISYLTYDQIDRKKWDDCIEASFNGMVYAKSWYLDIVAEKWDGMVEDDYERVFPLVWGKKMGIHYMYQPVFTQQLGVFSKKNLTEKIIIDFLQAIPSRFRYAEISLNTFNNLTSWKTGLHKWKNFELDLIHSIEWIRNNYTTNLRRNLKKTGEFRLQLMKNTRPEEIIRIFRENRGREIFHLKDADYMKLSRLIYTGIYRGAVTTYGVYSPTNDLCAGAVFLRSKKKVIFLFSGLTPQGKEYNAMSFLIDSFIAEHAPTHLTLDFEGSNHPGLARFYQSFGAQEVQYCHLIINRLPLLFSTGVKMVRTLRKII